MLIQERSLQMKDGQTILLRSVTDQDATAVCNHRYLASGETHYMARYPEECILDPEGTKLQLQKTAQDERDFEIGAFLDGELIGSAGIKTVKKHIKYTHRAFFGISILMKHCNHGLGSILLETSLKQARENGFEQVELGVFDDNERAIHLYEKCGFKRVGIQPRAYKLKDDTYHDEILMVHLF